MANPTSGAAPVSLLQHYGQVGWRGAPLDEPANYEPSPEDSVLARARARGVSPWEEAYDRLLDFYRRSAGGKAASSLVSSSAGDYLAGPNHTLPTGGTARFFSPLSVDDFIKKSSLFFSKKIF